MSSGNNEQNKEVNDIELVTEEVDISVEDSLSEEVADNEVDEEIVVGESTEDSAEESELEPDEIAQEESESSVEEIDPPTYEELQSENEELKTQLEALSGRLRTVSEAFHKKSDEVADTKKRLERQGEFNKTRLRGDVVSTMFAPFENLKRSIEACEKAEVDEAMVSGLLMVRDEIWTSLKNLGLEEIPGVGSLFNPSIHEALTSIPVQDPVLNDTIIQVYSTGYRINDLVVKTAQVIIGKYYAPPKEEVIEVLEGEEVEDSEATEESEVIDESNTDEVEE
jgi:molecular chaperone GrpE